MAGSPISSFELPRLAELPEDVRARIELVQEKTGFVPMSSWCWLAGLTSFGHSSPTTMR
jgi:hypothetical protein